MSFLSSLASLLVPQPDLQERSASEFPPLDEQLAAIRRAQASARPWRSASIEEALGVPAIWGAVSLIANTVGTLSLEGYRRGALMDPPPRLIERPNPFSTPRVFFRDTAFYLATRGEAWWWVAMRDPRDDTPLSLYPVPPWEVIVEQNDRNRLKPIIKWNDRVMRNEDMRQITYMTSGLDGRGVGPLQKLGAAVSVAVEADAWAANFYSGSMPSMVGTTDQDLDELDLKEFDKQWVEKPNNLPRWLTSGMTLSEPPYNPDKAQLTESRQHQVGEVARGFNMPGALIEYQMGGSSLTYQNQADIYQDFQRRCLSPNYLEPIEQEISDLLPMSQSGRFNLKQLLRADAKTRMEVHKTAIETGIYGPEVAAREEGYAPGAVDYAPVRPAAPAAVPDRLAYQTRSVAVRCDKCNKLLAETATAPYRMTCPRCKTVTQNLQERTAEKEEAPAPQVINVHPTPVTMEAPKITFERGAFEAPDMSSWSEALASLANQPAPTVNVDVAAPDMGGVAEAIHGLAERSQPPIEVNVTTPDVHVAPPSITFAEGSIQSPDVSVHPAAVTVTVPEQPAPQVTVNLPKPGKRKVVRDAKGQITEIAEE